MKEFLDYDIKHPDLIISILEYFWFDAKFNEKTVIDFCTNNKYCTSSYALQPQVIIKICDLLVQNNIMSVNRRGGALEGNTCYSFVWRNDQKIWKDNKMNYNHYYCSLVYGFEYIYKYYRDKVIPIIACKDGEKSMGTTFKFSNGLVTARHCITDHDSYAIQGYDAGLLNSSKIYVSKNPNIDVAYIDLGEPAHLFSDEAHVLDEVLVMGYPKIPTFLDFLTAEKATISTMATLRMAPTRGDVAAIAENMYTHEQTRLMLITAKIKGGNSGGPIINKKGCVVGVAFGQPISEGHGYDDLGYGMGLPIQILDPILEENEIIHANFINWSELEN